MKLPKVPVSIGELVDKITILAIKLERISDDAKLVNIRREHEALSAVWEEVSGGAEADVSELVNELKSVNEALWDIEDRIRIKESQRAFDEEFIELARSVYITNDRRSVVKRHINEAMGSDLVEEKSYEDYQSTD